MAVLTLTTNNATWGSVVGGGTYDNGTSVTIKATASNGYTFVAWQDNAGRVVYAADEYTFTITEDTTLQAIFISSIGAVDIWAYCDANCKHRVLSAGQTMHLVQEMLANGGQIPSGFVPATAVNAILEQNEGRALKLWVGTQAQWDSWTGNKDDVFSIITDDKSLEEILARLDAIESSIDAIENSIESIIDGVPPLSIKKYDGTMMQIVEDENGVLRFGEHIIPYRKPIITNAEIVGYPRSTHFITVNLGTIENFTLKSEAQYVMRARWEYKAGSTPYSDLREILLFVRGSYSQFGEFKLIPLRVNVQESESNIAGKSGNFNFQLYQEGNEYCIEVTTNDVEMIVPTAGNEANAWQNRIVITDLYEIIQ